MNIIREIINLCCYSYSDELDGNGLSVFGLPSSKSLLVTLKPFPSNSSIYNFKMITTEQVLRAQLIVLQKHRMVMKMCKGSEPYKREFCQIAYNFTVDYNDLTISEGESNNGKLKIHEHEIGK